MGDDDEAPRIRRFFADACLSSPILDLPIASLRIALSTVTRDTQSVRSKSKDQMTALQFLDLTSERAAHHARDVEPEDYPSFIHRLLELYGVHTPATAQLQAAKSVADELFSDLVGGLQEKMSIPDPAVFPSMTSALARIELKPITLSYYSVHSMLRALLIEIRRDAAHGNKHLRRVTVRGMEVIANKDFVFLPDLMKPGAGNYIFFSYDQFLMFTDLFHSRFLVYLTAEIHFRTKVDTLHALIGGTIDYQEKCLELYGNIGYEVAKAVEPIAKAYLSEVTDAILIRPTDFERMTKKYREKERELRPGITEPEMAVPAFERLLRTTVDVSLIVQVFGLQKISGHPRIDHRRGAREAAAHAQADDTTSYLSAKKLRAAFCHLALQGYLAKHKAWPPLVFNLPGTRLQRLHTSAYMDINDNSYPLEDWFECEWGKILDFNYSPNYLELLDDKAIGFPRDMMAAAWDNGRGQTYGGEELGSRPRHANGALKPIPTRRLLLEMLDRKEISPKEIVMQICHRKIPAEWLIVALYPKEREMKVSPRMFSMLCFEIRMFFCLAEQNLAEGVFEYFPQQTMTSTGSAVIRRFEGLTSPIQASTLLRLFIEVDLTRWNLRWRALAIHMIGDTLNRMYGLSGVYTFSHQFFADALIHVRVGGDKPTGVRYGEMHPPESDLLWYHHKGGFEGICQKHWTLATLAMVWLAMRGKGVKFVLTGQGDNQVLAIWRRYQPGEDQEAALQTLYNSILPDLELEAENVNQIIKPEECLRSTAVVTYSKHVWVEGVYIPTTLKAHSRLFPVSATDLPTLADNVGAIYSGALGAAEKSEDPLLCWYIANLLAVDYIRTISVHGDIHGSVLASCTQWKRLKAAWPRSWIHMLLTLPPTLGGLPVAPWTSFIFKGESDPLVSQLVSLQVLSLQGDRRRCYRGLIHQLFEDSYYSDTPDLLNLISDPYSIPLRRPAAPKEALREETLSHLEPQIKNIAVKELVGLAISDFANSLIDNLTRCRPFYPLPFHDIYAESPAGLRDEFRAKFTNTRSVQAIARAGGADTATRLMMGDFVQFSSILDRLSRVVASDTRPVTEKGHVLADRLRARWKVPICGITNVHPMDFEFGINTPAPAGPVIQGLSVLPAGSLRHTRGPITPYLGSKTREKRADYGIQAKTKHPGTVAVRKLALISSQLSGDPDFTALLNAVAQYRTGEVLEYSNLLHEHVYGGTPAHRYDAIRGRPSAYLSQTPNVATSVLLSSDNTGKYSGGMEDYPIVFQEFFLSCTWLIGFMAPYLPADRPVSSWISLSDSIPPITSEKVKFASPPKALQAIRTQNPLVFTPVIHYEQIGNLLRSPTIGHTILNMEKLNQLGWDNITASYIGSWLDRRNIVHTAADIMYNTVPPSDELDLLEVQRIGVKNLFQGTALAIARRARVEAQRQYGRNFPRHREQVVVLKLVDAATTLYVRALCHPMVRSDPYVKQHRLFLGLGGVAPTTLLKRVRGNVVNEVFRILDDPMHPAYNAREIITMDGSSGLFSRTAASWALWQLSRLPQGYLDERTRARIIRTTILPVVQQPNETAAEGQIFQMLVMLNEQLRAQAVGHEMITDMLTKALEGRVFTGLFTSTKELLREARNLPSPTPLPLRPATYVNNTQPRPTPLVINYRRSVGITGYTELAGQPEIPFEDMLYKAYITHRGCNKGYYSIAHTHWLPVLAEENVGGHVLLVGSGAGGVAVAAIKTGALEVTGIDLVSTIPKTQHRYASYIPPEVLAHGYEDRFRYSAAMWATSGDWAYEETVRYALEDRNFNMILIDIEAGRTRCDLQVLENLRLLQYCGRVAVKMYLNRAEIEQIYADAKAISPKARIYIADRATASEYLRVIVVLDLTAEWEPMQVLYSDVKPWNIPPYPRANDSRWPDATEHILEELAGGFLYAVETKTLVGVARGLERLYDTIKGDQRGRLSQREFQRLKAGFIISTKLLDTPIPEREAAIETWLRSDTLVAQGYETGVRATLLLENEHKVLIAKVASRLLPSYLPAAEVAMTGIPWIVIHPPRD